MSHAEDLLEMIENDPDFADSKITDDESLCFLYDYLTKQQSKAWIGPKSLGVIKLCFQNLKIKTILILFFNNIGVVCKEFVLESRTVTKKFYLVVLRSFAEANCTCETRGMEESQFQSAP